MKFLGGLRFTSLSTIAGLSMLLVLGIEHQGHYDFYCFPDLKKKCNTNEGEE